MRLPFSGQAIIVAKRLLITIIDSFHFAYRLNQVFKYDKHITTKVNGLNPGEPVHVSDGRSSRLP